MNLAKDAYGPIRQTLIVLVTISVAGYAATGNSVEEPSSTEEVSADKDKKENVDDTESSASADIGEQAQDAAASGAGDDDDNVPEGEFTDENKSGASGSENAEGSAAVDLPTQSSDTESPVSNDDNGATEAAPVDDSESGNGEVGDNAFDDSAFGDEGAFGEEALGGDLAELDSMSLDELMGTVYAASGREERVFKAPATVSIIEAKHIRSSGERTIPDLLRRVPGVQVFQSAPGNYHVSLRGMGGLQDNNVIVLLDGFPINSLVTGSIDWAGLPVHVDEIDRIEVIRGPVSTIFGANAYTGVINIVTLEPAKIQTSLRAGIFGGGSNRGKIAAGGHGVSTGALDAMTWKVGVHAVETGVGGYNDPERDLQAKPSANVGGRVVFDYEFSDNVTFNGVFGGSFSHRAGLNHLVIEPVTTQRALLLASAAVNLDFDNFVDAVSFWARMQKADVHRADTRFPDAVSFDRVQSQHSTTGADVRLELPWEVFTAFGVETGFERIAAPFLLGGVVEGIQLFNYASKATIEKEFFDSWAFSAGVRADRSALAGFRLSGRTSLNYFSDDFAVRLAAAHGFRQPTYVEVAGHFTDPTLDIIVLEGNDSLTPQQITSVELGVTFSPLEKWMLSTVVYGMRLDNVISENFEPIVKKSFSNTSFDWTQGNMVGIEMESSWVLADYLIPSFTFSGIWWPGEQQERLPLTVGVPENNSAVTAALGLRGAFFDGQLGYGGDIVYGSPRSYELQAGVPPRLISAQIDHRLRLAGVVDYQILGSPFWVWLRGQTNYPHDEKESPFPSAGTLGTSILVGGEFKGI